MSDAAWMIVAAASVCGACAFSHFSGFRSGYLQGAADREREYERERTNEIVRLAQEKKRELEARPAQPTERDAKEAIERDLIWPNIR